MSKPWCGVYAICDIDGGVYVGASVNIRRRLTYHARELTRGTHSSINEPKPAVVLLIEKCSPSKLDEREVFWIKRIGTLNRMPGGRLNIASVNADPEVRRQRSIRAMMQHRTGSLHSYFNSATGKAAQRLSSGNRRKT